MSSPLTTRLRDVAEINPRFAANGHMLDMDISFVPMANVSADGTVICEDTRKLGGVIKGFTPFQNEDILVAKITPCFENNKIIFASIRWPLGFASTEFHVVRPDPQQLNGRYVFHFLRQERIRNEGRARMTGSAGQRRVPADFLEGIEISIPPLPEQQRIAAILDKADALRQKRREAIAKLDTLLQSVFLDMFGDPVTNPKGWPVAPMTYVLDFQTGKLDANAAVTEGQYPFFTCSRDDYRIDKWAFDCEALILSGNNASADYSVKHYRGKFNAYQRTYVITLKNASHSYTYMKMALQNKLAELKQHSKGANTRYLTLELFNRLEMQVPSVERQKSFDDLAANFNSQRDLSARGLLKLEKLHVSLQNSLFHG